MTDALADLSAAGVAVWIDDLSRERLRSGNLQELVDTRSVVGVTTNPSIFQKALSDGAAYDAQVRDLALRGTDVGEAVRALTTYDVRWACDVLKPQYDSSDRPQGRRRRLRPRGAGARGRRPGQVRAGLERPHRVGHQSAAGSRR
jgi:transaldolase